LKTAPVTGRRRSPADKTARCAGPRADSSPRLLLLDEPLGALDALTRLEMQDLIVSLWQEHGFTVLLVTHDVSEAVAMADRVLLIEEGRLASMCRGYSATAAHGSAKLANWKPRY
jgi:sulfonate transport system ATP-binding protein